MGGVELIIALTVAGAVTNAARQGTARVGQTWRSHKQRREDKARDRERRAQARTRQTRRRVVAAKAWVAGKSRNPAHPVGWAYGLGWLAATTGAAAVAGVNGARQGAATGARQGARLGRAAAREGWGYAATWREWRAQRAAHDAQETRRAQHEGRACSCGSDDPRWLAATEAGVVCLDCLRRLAWDKHRTGPPQPGQRMCRRCGTNDTNLLTTDGDQTICVPCLLRQRTRDATRNERWQQQPPPLLVSCLTCRQPVTREAAQITGGYCGSCATSAPDRDCDPPADEQHDDPAAHEPIDAEVVPDDIDGHAAPCPRCVRSSADGPVYPHCQDTHPSGGGECHASENDSENSEKEEPVTTDTTSIQQGALTSGHEGGEMGIEDTRTIYRQISAQGTTVGELIDRLATSLGHFGASGADITEAQQVAEAAEALVTAAENARANHDSRNTMTEQAAVEETDAVRDTDYHRLGK